MSGLIIALVWWAIVLTVSLALTDVGARWWIAGAVGAIVASCSVMLAAVFDEAMTRSRRR